MSLAKRTAKEVMLQVLLEQPDDSSYDELLRELAISGMIERGLADSGAGRALGHEEVRERIAAWGNSKQAIREAGTAKRYPKRHSEEDMGALSRETLERRAHVVDSTTTPLPRGASIESLMELARTISPESAQEMLDAIEPELERADPEGGAP